MHTISLYICLFVCFQKSGILWVHQMTMLPGALLMGFYSHICPVAVSYTHLDNHCIDKVHDTNKQQDHGQPCS